jgi:hypothetical protein
MTTEKQDKKLSDYLYPRKCFRHFHGASEAIWGVAPSSTQGINPFRNPMIGVSNDTTIGQTL